MTTSIASLRLLALTGALLLSLGAAEAALAAYEDPPGRVARLSDSQGEISYSPSGEDDWIRIGRNRPLVRGDRFWSDRNARAEFQVGNALVRLGSHTSFEIMDLDDDYAQMRLTEGTVNLRVRRMYPGQVYEIATPALSFTINRAGRYRIDVEPYDDVTTIVVWEGGGEVYGEDQNYRLRAGDTVRFYGHDLRDHQMYGLPRMDDFDRYCLGRDQRLDRSTSLRYLDDDVVGYSDLDDYGDWRQVRDLGVVWFPRRVGRDWAPYRDGRWAWHEPWGWTWIDDAPWGFAPSHYGRWAHVQDRWGWIPGQRNARSVYSPALVVFLGGNGWNPSRSSGNRSPIGWFPLGPREVYVPSYRASREYFTRVNVNNTVISNRTITNIYNNYSSGDINVRDVRYVNRGVEGAVTAVAADVFASAQSVRQARIRVASRDTERVETKRIAAIAPSARSVLGTGETAHARPPRVAVERVVIARKSPPAAQRSFTAREAQLQRSPGHAPEVSQALPATAADARAARKVRVIDDNRDAADVREPASARVDGAPAAQAGPPGTLQPLDRSLKPARGAGRGQARGRDQGESQRLDAERRLAACEEAAERQPGNRVRESRTLCRQEFDRAIGGLPEAARGSP